MQKNVAPSAFTLIEIMIVVAIIGLLCSIAVPNLVRARETVQTSACVNNLRLIDAAKQQWAFEHNQGGTATPVALDIQPYLGRGTYGVLPYCPIDRSRTFATSYNTLAINLVPTCIQSTANGITNHYLPIYY